MLQAPKSNVQRTLAPEGTHHAVVVGLIEIGTVEGEWKGQVKMQSKIRLTFELPEETKVWKEGEEAKPLVVSQEYTFSMAPKANLRAIIEGVIGTSLLDHEADAFDVEEILGKNCLISIKHKTSNAGNKYVIVDTTAPLMKGMSEKKPFNELKKLTYGEWNQEIFDGLPEFLQKQMQETPEYQSQFGTEPVERDAEKDYENIDAEEKKDDYPEAINPDDIPF